MRVGKPGIFIAAGGGGGGGKRSAEHQTVGYSKLSPWCDPESTAVASKVSPAPQTWYSHPDHGLWGCSPSPLPRRSASVAANTCGSALEQVQHGHQPSQTHHVLTLTSLLAGAKRGSQGCGGNREGNSPAREVFTVLLPALPVLSPQHTPFFPAEILHPATPLPHFQTVHCPAA